MKKKPNKMWIRLGAALAVSVLAGGPAVLRAAGGHEGMRMDMEHEHGMKMDKKGGQSRFVVVKGEVVDLSCYMSHEGRGKKHRKCAKACLLKGLPAGILTESGKLYLVVESHGRKSEKAYRRVQELAGYQVELQGNRFMRNGMTAIAVTKVEKVK